MYFSPPPHEHIQFCTMPLLPLPGCTCTQEYLTGSTVLDETYSWVSLQRVAVLTPATLTFPLHATRHR